jgi:hypothetical protein
MSTYRLVCSFTPTFPGGGAGVSGSMSKDHVALSLPVILMIEDLSIRSPGATPFG